MSCYYTPQNGDHIVTIDSVTSPRPMYTSALRRVTVFACLSVRPSQVVVLSK